MDPNPEPKSQTSPAEWETLAPEVIDLVQRSQAGDTLAFADLQRRFYAPVLRYARTRFGDARDAEDVAVEIFVTLYRALPALSDTRRFVGFLFGTARNVCNYRQERMRRQRIQEVPMYLSDPSEETRPGAPGLTVPGADEDFQRREARREIERAISRLPALEREPLLLRYQEQFSYKQIASMLNVPVDTVEHRVRQARRRLSLLLPPDFAL